MKLVRHHFLTIDPQGMEPLSCGQWDPESVVLRKSCERACLMLTSLASMSSGPLAVITKAEFAWAEGTLLLQVSGLSEEGELDPYLGNVSQFFREAVNLDFLSRRRAFPTLK